MSKRCPENVPKVTYLVVLIEPEESKVGHSNWLPVVLNLLACAVDDMSDFVRHYEFQILRQKLPRYIKGHQYVRIQIKSRL